MRAWDEYLKSLEPELGKETLQKWAKSLKITHFDAANLYLEALDSFQAQWLEQYLLPRARQKFFNENGRLVKIHLTVAQKKLPTKTSKKEGDLGSPISFIQDPIDPSYTFDSLIETEQNKIIFKLFSELKNFTPDTSPVYNPIYIYGPSGIGKTHLLQATAQALKTQNFKVCYVQIPTFTQNMVSAIKTGQMGAFRTFYRDCNILIVDDLHHLGHKTTTQEEFFHTFNSLHLEGKQIILSAPTSPGQLEQIEPRLTSRFEWGIVLPLVAPKAGDLKKILNRKLKEVQLTLSAASKDYLIEKFAKNPKVLSKALNALILRAHLKLPQGQQIDPQKLTPSSIEKLLSDLIKKEEKEHVTVDKIIDQIAHYYGVKIDDILGKSQCREHVIPRQISMFFCREYLKLPFMKIGRIFSRDHSTVMSSVKQIQKGAALPQHDFFKVVNALKSRIFN